MILQNWVTLVQLFHSIMTTATITTIFIYLFENMTFSSITIVVRTHLQSTFPIERGPCPLLRICHIHCRLPFNCWITPIFHCFWIIIYCPWFKRAGSDWEVVVRSFSRSIDPLEEKGEVTIRITNINSETTDSAVHSMCTSCGGLEGLVRTKEDAVDALFSVKDNAGIKRIIKR